jgi:hypothetical protein
MSLGNTYLLKLAEEHPENSSYLTAPLRDPIRQEANIETHTHNDAILTNTVKNRHDKDGMHDTARMVRCTLSILIRVKTLDK